MELVQKKVIPDLRNAPKCLYSKFHGARSKYKTTLVRETANGDEPLRGRMGHIFSIAASLASLAPLR